MRGNLKLAQQLLGHADIKSTPRHAHALEADLRNALEHPHSPSKTQWQRRKLREREGRARHYPRNIDRRRLFRLIYVSGYLLPAAGLNPRFMTVAEALQAGWPVLFLGAVIFTVGMLPAPWAMVRLVLHGTPTRQLDPTALAFNLARVLAGISLVSDIYRSLFPPFWPSSARGPIAWIVAANTVVFLWSFLQKAGEKLERPFHPRFLGALAFIVMTSAIFIAGTRIGVATVVRPASDQIALRDGAAICTRIIVEGQQSVTVSNGRFGETISIPQDRIRSISRGGRCTAAAPRSRNSPEPATRKPSQSVTP